MPFLPPMRPKTVILIVWANLLFVWTVQSHPVPDIPVKTDFVGKTASIEVEIDPRSFTDDPENEPYLYYRVLKLFSEDEKKELQEQAQRLIDTTVFFQFEPDQQISPKFLFEFTGIDSDKLSGDEDPVMLTGTAVIEVPQGGTGYRIIADKSGELSVIFRNSFGGKEVERFNVLFPGESSYILDLPSN